MIETAITDYIIMLNRSSPLNMTWYNRDSFIFKWQNCNQPTSCHGYHKLQKIFSLHMKIMNIMSILFDVISNSPVARCSILHDANVCTTYTKICIYDDSAVKCASTFCVQVAYTRSEGKSLPLPIFTITTPISQVKRKPQKKPEAAKKKSKTRSPPSPTLNMVEN